MPIIKTPSKSKLEKLKKGLPVNFQQIIKEMLLRKKVKVSVSTVSHVLNGRVLYDKHGIIECAIELIKQNKQEQLNLTRKLDEAIKDID